MLARPLPAIESDQTRDVVAGYLVELRPLVDRATTSSLRIAMRRHILAVQERLDEYDARNDERPGQ